MLSERAERVARVAVVVGCTALYSASLRFGLTYDDSRTVIRHEGVQGPWSFSAVFLRDSWGLPFSDVAGTGWWRPLPALTYWIDRHVGHGALWLFHATNLAIYACVLAATDRFLRTWAGARVSAGARLAIVAAFGALTLHVDVVPSVTGRAELLAALCGLIALERASRERTRRVDLVVFAVASCGAIMSKESAITLPILAVILAARRDSTLDRRGLAAVSVIAAIVVAAALIFRVKLGLPFGPRSFGSELSNPLFARSIGARWIGATEVFTHYLAHTTTGIDLCPDYAYATIVPSTSWSVRASIGVAIGAVICAWGARSWRRDPRVADAVIAFGCSYAVISHVAFPSSAILADRNFFFPSLWVCVLAGLALDRAKAARARLVIGTTVPLAIVCQALFTVLATPAWRDNRTLAAYALQSCPTNTRMRVLLATTDDAVDRTREAAWQVLIAAAIAHAFPRPLDDDTFPLAWDALPMSERVTHLRDAVGGDAELEIIQARAIDLAGAESMPNTAVLLTEWPSRVPTPDWLRERLEAIGKGSLAH